MGGVIDADVSGSDACPLLAPHDPFATLNAPFAVAGGKSSSLDAIGKPQMQTTAGRRIADL